MLDSGASVHMLRTSDLSEFEACMVGPLRNPINLGTANGVVPSDRGFDIRIDELDMTDEVHVCDHAPKGMGVLSIGRLMSDHGCRFQWVGDHCIFATGSKRNLKVHIECHVPFVPADIHKDTFTTAASIMDLLPYCPDGENRKAAMVALWQTFSEIEEASVEQSMMTSPLAAKQTKPHQAHWPKEPSESEETNTLKYFVEIFSGTGKLSCAVKASGCFVYSFDIVNGHKGDHEQRCI